MSTYKRFTDETESICWTCENCTNENKCKWASCEPRDDWQVKHERGGITVRECPGYKADWIHGDVKTISKILGVCQRTVHRYDNARIVRKLNEHGYAVKIFYIADKRYCYIAKKEIQ